MFVSYSMLWRASAVELEAPRVAPAPLDLPEHSQLVPPRAMPRSIATKQPATPAPPSRDTSSAVPIRAFPDEEAQLMQAREALDRGVERTINVRYGLAARFDQAAAAVDPDATLLDALDAATGGGAGVIEIECRIDVCRVMVDRTTIDIEHLSESLREATGSIVQSWPVPLFANELDATSTRPEDMYLLMHADAASSAEGLLKPSLR